MAVCTWKDRRTPSLIWESGGKKCGYLSGIYGITYSVSDDSEVEGTEGEGETVTYHLAVEVMFMNTKMNR